MAFKKYHMMTQHKKLLLGAQIKRVTSPTPTSKFEPKIFWTNFEEKDELTLPFRPQ